MSFLRTTPGFPRDCHWCRVRLRDPADDMHRRSRHSATRDHVYPKCKGGVRTVWACRHCNQLKGNLLPHEWKEFRSAWPEYRRHFDTHHEVRQGLISLRWSRGRASKPPACFPAGLVAAPPLCRGLAA